MTPPKVTRRRTINRPEGTFAHFLDALISYDFAHFHPDPSGFTAYKAALADNLQIQPRQLSRLLSGEVLPEFRILDRLSNRFPHQIQTEGWIPRLKWECIAQEMELLPERSVITVLVGHLSADDVDAFSPMVLKDLGSTMLERNFKYVYVLAPLSERLRRDELAPIHLAERLRLKILSRWLDVNPNTKRDSTLERHIAQRFLVFQTQGGEESAQFWCRLPRYLIASNLLADPESVYVGHQFSAAFDSGSVPYPPNRADSKQHVPEPVSSGGWMYWNRDYDIEFREMFRQLVELDLLLDPEHQRRFPRPG